MTTSRFLIYGLVDPQTLLIRYVGRSSSGFKHPRTYKNPSHLKDSTHRCRWIKGLLSEGLVYEIVSLEEVVSADAQLRQRAEDSTWRTFSDSLTPAEYRVLTSFGRTAYGFWYDAQRRPGP